MKILKLDGKQIFAGLGLLLASLAIYALLFGLWPRYFDIEWDEEVKLHDGRVIVVHVKRTFERTSRISRWEGIHRDTEISFDAGGSIGRFSRKFQRYDIDFIHEKGGYWYIYLINTTGTPPVKLVNWDAGFIILRPDGSHEAAINWNQLPLEFVNRNIMPPSPNSAGIKKFHHTKLTLAEKSRHWSDFPAGAGDDEILRRPRPVKKDN